MLYYYFLLYIETKTILSPISRHNILNNYNCFRRTSKSKKNIYVRRNILTILTNRYEKWNTEYVPNMICGQESEDILCKNLRKNCTYSNVPIFWLVYLSGLVPVPRYQVFEIKQKLTFL